LSKETTFTYEANGNLSSQTDANSDTTNFGYNSNGDLTSVTDPLSHTLSYTYDDVGNMLTQTDANSHTTSLAYDQLNRLTSVTNALSQQTTFGYDANGNLTSTTDAESNTTTNSYDALNRLSRVTDALSNQTNYSYDQMDNLKTIEDAESHTTTFSYDAANQLISESDPLSNSTTYSYDNAGNLVNRTDANGDSTSYTYDNADRLTAIDYPGSNDVSYSYDNVGNITGMSNANVSVSQSFDAANQLTNASVTVGVVNKSISYTYDNVGNRATMTDHDGGVTTYTYDDANRLSSLVNPASQTTSYTYDNGDRLIRKDNGTYALYTHDDANRLLSVTNKDSLDTTLSSYSYQYDNAGNRTRMIEEGGDQTDYTYDDLYRLTGVTYPDSTTASYTYDAVGNRTQLVDSGTTNYTYDNADRLLSAGSISYGWDSNGNQISKAESGNTTTYAYDYENRMTGITFPDSSANSFIYYPDGLRFNLTDKAGTATYYLYDNFNALVETNSSGTTTARYTSGLGIDEWISMDRGGSSYAYQRDGLGSVVGLTDDSETLVASYSYDAFGSVRGETGSVVNPYRFTGREYDEESDLYFYRTRYYESEVGRFTTKDHFSGFLESPLSLNKYEYVNGNPINFVDPHGLLLGIIVVGIIAIVATQYVVKPAIESGTKAYTSLKEAESASQAAAQNLTPESYQQLQQSVVKAGANMTIAATQIPGTFSGGTPPTSIADVGVAATLGVISDIGSGDTAGSGNTGGTHGGGGGGTGSTVITLTSFTATTLQNGVLLEWKTASEIDNAGFHIWRSEEKDGEYIKITDSLILAEGDASTYTFIDENVKDGVTYYYKLEDIDIFDVSTFRYPVSSSPDKVLIIEPAQNAVFTPDTPPRFEWSDDRYSEFKFQFSDDNGRTIHEIPANGWMEETSITPPAAAWKEYAQTRCGQIIFWRVVGKNGQGQTFSEVRSLTIE